MSPTQLKKTIGLWSATSIVIGSIIGANIFMKPATMAAQLGSPYLILLVWLIAGVVSMFGAMAYAELGAMFPETGGQYVYLRYAFGDFIAYLYGWASIAVINTASIAAIGFVFASYTGYFIALPQFSTEVQQSVVLHIPLIGDIFPLQNFGVKALAIIMIMGLSVVNYLSVRSGNAVQFIATVLKTAAILLLVLGLLFSGKGDTANFITNAPGFDLTGWKLIGAFMAATTGAFAAYDGWNNLNMVAGEMKEPSKNITRSLMIGLWTCIIIYMLVTLAYIYVLPIEVMATSPLVASDAAAVVMGSVGGTAIALLIVISTFGSTNVNLLACARVIFAMSDSKIFFKHAGEVHPKFHTPGNAVLILGVWSSLFVLSGSFDLLADMFIFIGWVFYGLVILGLFILRKRMPNAERPYKAWGYPLVPILFLLFTGLYIVTTLYNDITNYVEGKSTIINSVFGLLLTAAGIPLYFYFKWKNKKQV
ncbi:APC family permease [Lacibacter sp.]|uniref:APC family permease n=1 Tax=Lacibacter sp. TaxID=1915409 RepID=UPI002B4AB27F|nr:amino acid permease [Lacibacter sp.]HLP36759.1 amino acid permease [Lacibacter sp.]